MGLDVQLFNNATAGEPPSLLVLEDHYSNMDQRVGPRPYVYQVTAKGLQARWRGTSLAYPLIDVAVLPENGADILCALHSGDSFLVPDLSKETLHTLAYTWNGFGFSADKDAVAQAKCRAHYFSETTQYFDNK